MVQPTPLTRHERETLVAPLLTHVGIDISGPEFREALFAQHSEQITTGGVRAGKSMSAAAKLLLAIAEKLIFSQKALYWIVGPDYLLSRPEMIYLRQWCEKLGWKVDFNNPTDGGWNLVIKDMIRIECKTAENEDKLAGVAPDGILVVEAGKCRPEVRDRVRERAMEKAAWIYYSGTMDSTEDQTYRQNWSWYAETAAEWEENPTPAHASYRLPSWTNKVLYGSCLTHITNNPALAAYCPDGEHGENHSGRNHPSIRQAELEWPPAVFARSIAAEPLGAEGLVYPQLENKSLLVEFDNSPEVDVYAGIDYGDNHPTALSVVTFHPRPGLRQAGEFLTVAWVREVVIKRNDPGDVAWLKAARADLQRRWKIPDNHFMADPNERYMAKERNAVAVSGNKGSRLYRIGLVTARLNADALYWDRNGPGVAEAYDEALHYRFIRDRQGQTILRREEDDMTSATEDAIEGHDAREQRGMPGMLQMKKSKYNKRVREKISI